MSGEKSARPRTVIPIRQAGPVDPEVALRRDGWKRQTTIGEPRLSEIVQNYEAMGFEVHVEAFRSGGDGCNTCYEAGQEIGQVYGTVYVRKRGEAAGGTSCFEPIRRAGRRRRADKEETQCLSRNA